MAKSFKKTDNPALNFINIEKNNNTQDVYNTYKTQETQEVQKTQGRKGQKLPRMNMAFYGDNLPYINKMSRLKGVTATAYINELIEQDKEKNKDILKEIEKFIN